MIISVRGETIIKGNISELTQDFCATLSAIMDKAPEIVLAGEAEYSDNLIDMLDKVDEHTLALCKTFASDFRKLNKENEEDD